MLNMRARNRYRISRMTQPKNIIFFTKGVIGTVNNVSIYYNNFWRDLDYIYGHVRNLGPGTLAFQYQYIWVIYHLGMDEVLGCDCRVLDESTYGDSNHRTLPWTQHDLLEFARYSIILNRSFGEQFLLIF